MTLFRAHKRRAITPKRECLMDSRVNSLSELWGHRTTKCLLSARICNPKKRQFGDGESGRVACGVAGNRRPGSLSAIFPKRANRALYRQRVRACAEPPDCGLQRRGGDRQCFRRAFLESAGLIKIVFNEKPDRCCEQQGQQFCEPVLAQLFGFHRWYRG